MPNRLSRETSPYLQQHADNPVDWYPWGEEALGLARAQDKPILLSIGYSACHWCHVMAHESFEDSDVAALMNAYFVNIKVDREERPDIDQIYQAAHSLMSQRSGGWPLTMFLTPQQELFFSGTYFPRTTRYQLPGFGDLVVRVAQFYHERKGDLAEQGRALLQALARTVPTPGTALTAGENTLRLGFEHLKSSFDFEHGGFGGAPKFPNPADIGYLLRQAGTGNPEAGTMVLQMLSGMAAGGIYDQLGGGFCRYSVDERWMIPHFEKMLYDNGQLLHLYADGWQLCRGRYPELAARFAVVIEETVQWLLREMRAPEGAFYSSLDADSPNEQGHSEEGAFYVWQIAQLKALLTPEELVVAGRCFGFDRPENFEGRAWHPYFATSPTPEDETLLARARHKLLDARERRARPGRDDKILTSWNALTIKGLTHAGRLLQRPEWIAVAQQAVDFIHARLWKNGRLLATCKGEVAHLNAYLDDYAFLLDALLELMQTDYRAQDMAFAESLAEALLEEFEAENGGFYFTGHHHETLIHRSKQGYDTATPSGNGIAAIALQRLGHVLGEVRYLQAAERTLRAFDSSMQRNPAACASLLVALADYLQPPVLLVLRGNADSVAQWRLAIDAHYLPQLMCLALPSTLESLPQNLMRPAPADDVNAWLCRGVECLPAIHSLDDLMAHISAFQPQSNMGMI